MIANQRIFGVFFWWWMDFLKRLDVWVLKRSGFIPKIGWSDAKESSFVVPMLPHLEE